MVSKEVEFICQSFPDGEKIKPGRDRRTFEGSDLGHQNGGHLVTPDQPFPHAVMRPVFNLEGRQQGGLLASYRANDGQFGSSSPWCLQEKIPNEKLTKSGYVTKIRWWVNWGKQISLVSK